MTADHKKRSMFSRPIVWLLLVVAVLGAAFFGLRARGPKVRATLAVRRDLEQHLVASGRVWVPTRVQVSAQLSGLVVAVGAAEGQHVKAGDLLVQLDDAEARASVAQAKAAVEQASARVEQLRRVGAIVTTEGLRQAQTNFERAETELGRTQALTTSGALAPTQLEEARRALDIARAQKAVAEAQQVSSAPLGADSRVALTSLLQAQAQLAGANVRLSQTRLAAVGDGVVLTRTVEPGNVVQPGKTLLVMAVDGDVQLVFQPDERTLTQIALGQKALASADAAPQQVFDAEVSYLAPQIDAQRGSIEVRLRVPKPPPFLKPDMTVSVDLTVGAVKQAVVVPSDAIRGPTSPSPWVLVVSDGRVARREVKLGLRGEGSTELVSGVEAGVEVLLPEGQLLVPGQRVRAELE